MFSRYSETRSNKYHDYIKYHDLDENERKTDQEIDARMNALGLDMYTVREQMDKDLRNDIKYEKYRNGCTLLEWLRIKTNDWFEYYDENDYDDYDENDYDDYDENNDDYDENNDDYDENDDDYDENNDDFNNYPENNDDFNNYPENNDYDENDYDEMNHLTCRIGRGHMVLLDEYFNDIDKKIYPDNTTYIEWLHIQVNLLI